MATVAPDQDERWPRGRARDVEAQRGERALLKLAWRHRARADGMRGQTTPFGRTDLGHRSRRGRSVRSLGQVHRILMQASRIVADPICGRQAV